MAHTCRYKNSIINNRLLFNRKHEHGLSERDANQILCWNEYFLAQKILLVDEENGWADPEDEKDDDQWEDDDKMDDDDW